jgi:AhpD family alkylhydroperoxidase
MSTIRYLRVENATGVAKTVYEDIMRLYGCPEPHGIYQLMGHTPEFLDASWPRSRYLFGKDTRLSLHEKHVLVLAISATNNCEYCVRIHTNRLQGLGMSESAGTELMAVVQLANGLAKFCEGTRAGDCPVIPEYAIGEGEPSADAALTEIANELDSIPESMYRIMARSPRFLRDTWDQVKYCFAEEGQLGIKLKYMVAFSVAATSGSEYLARVLARELNRLGFGDDDFVELLLVIDLTCGYNRYVQGLQADQEEKPFGEGAEMEHAPGSRSSVAAPVS